MERAISKAGKATVRPSPSMAMMNPAKVGAVLAAVRQCGVSMTNSKPGGSFMESTQLHHQRKCMGKPDYPR
jgi:hypothetical protein